MREEKWTKLFTHVSNKGVRMTKSNRMRLWTIQTKEIMRSWERIFDLELLKTHSEWTGGETIQACIEKIYTDEVVNVTYFKAR